MEKKVKIIKYTNRYRTLKNVILFSKLSKIISILSLFIIYVLYFHINKIFYEEKNIYNYVHVAVNIDNKYIYPCIVYITSLLENKADSTFYIIHILTGDDINKDVFTKVKATIEKFAPNSANVSFYNMKDQFKRATHGRFISTADYYKIALPSVLPNISRVIFTDADVITFKDLNEMYNIKLGKKIYYCGALDHGSFVNEIKHYFHIVIDKYINAGILLMNLEEIRNDGIEDKLRKFIDSHFLNHHDQTAINAVCYNNTQVLPYKYSSFAFDSYEKIVKFNNEHTEEYRFNESELQQAFYSPTIIHFPGYVKPWDKDCKKIRKVYWWYYAKLSLFYQEILDHYGFNNEEIEEILNQIPKEGSLIRKIRKKNDNKIVKKKINNNLLKIIISLVALNIIIFFIYIIN